MATEGAEQDYIVKDCYQNGDRSPSHASLTPSRSHASSLGSFHGTLKIQLGRLQINADDSSQKLRVDAAYYLYNPWCEASIGLLTIINFVVILIDTDLKAADEPIPVWIHMSSIACLCVYSCELAIRVYVERLETFYNAWNWLDFCVVALGIVAEVAQHLGSGFLNLTFLRVFRCFRLLRIVKAIGLIKYMRELRKLIRGIISCLKTLAWGWVLVFLFMTMWSTLAVEVLNPLMEDISQTGVWNNCERCPRSFTTVMGSNLTFFQTIIAGDSWGKVAIPVIEQFPFTVIIFVGSLFTLVVGILNLIVAVLVDTAAEARANDTAARALEASHLEKREKKALDRIFRQIDADRSGAVTFEELEEGAEGCLEFEQILRVMDIQGEDLHQLFMMLDEGGTGEIAPRDFIEHLYRLKCGDHKTASTFAKHYIVHMKKNQVAIIDKLQELDLRLQDMMKGLAMETDDQLENLHDDSNNILDAESSSPSPNGKGDRGVWRKHKRSSSETLRQRYFGSNDFQSRSLSPVRSSPSNACNGDSLLLKENGHPPLCTPLVTPHTPRDAGCHIQPLSASEVSVKKQMLPDSLLYNLGVGAGVDSQECLMHVVEEIERDLTCSIQQQITHSLIASQEELSDMLKNSSMVKQENHLKIAELFVVLKSSLAEQIVRSVHQSLTSLHDCRPRTFECITPREKIVLGVLSKQPHPNSAFSPRLAVK